MSFIGANISANEQALQKQLSNVALREVCAVVDAEKAAKNLVNQRSIGGELELASPVFTSWHVLQRQQAKFMRVIKRMAGISE